MVVAMSVDYRRYKNRGVVVALMTITIALLCAVFLFPKINNAHRWIRLGGFFSLQPSEIAKLALTIFLARFLEKNTSHIESFRRVVFPASAAAALVIGLVAREPDFGTSLVLAAVFASIMFYAGARLLHLTALASVALPVAIAMVVFVGWRAQRMLDFWDPWENPTGSSYQVVQSMIAIGSGGTSGLGFAQSHQKMMFLPAAHTDFIFSIIGEELGLIGAATVIILFGALTWRGFKAARSAPDMFGQLMAAGITVMIAAQACFNISVTLSLVPNKGIPLPFISSGGSSVAISLLAAGILLNISKHGRSNQTGARMRSTRSLRSQA
jgi:cell division protein FtsW